MFPAEDAARPALSTSLFPRALREERVIGKNHYICNMRATVSAITFLLIAVNLSASQPLHREYEELPLGCIRPEGWLREMLVRQSDGTTAVLDAVYPEVVGETNGWLGGDGDQWERGPYWIDGLLPLAYILDDDNLKAKASEWVEWALSSQQENGQFGPAKDYPSKPGLQRNNSGDWWPRMVVLKILMQHYNATGDERVIKFMQRYFRYQFETLPEVSLGHWTNWAEYRQCDNMLAVLWLYGKTGEEWLLDLAELLHTQGFDFISLMTGDELSRTGAIHCVNLAQGFKEPMIYGQISGDPYFSGVCRIGLDNMRRYDGFPNGMYGGDEALHGNSPTQGVELCSIVEMMYSMEQMMQISPDPAYAEQLERVAFNALPTQISDDFRLHQYFQRPNQVNIVRGVTNFDCENDGTAAVFGVLSGYPCCLCNLHQGWPKFTQNLWLRSSDGGLAALAYSPCSVTAKVGSKIISLREETYYPFEDKVRIKILDGSASFPLRLRIPSWAEGADVLVNGTSINGAVPGTVCIIDRKWKKGDVVELSFPMHVEVSRWCENSAAVERGPLVYALKLNENWTERSYGENDFSYPWKHGRTYWEVTTEEPWNYGLLDVDLKNPEKSFEVMVDKSALCSSWYWDTESCPVSIKARATVFPQWTLYNGIAGPIPYSKLPISEKVVSVSETVEITLIPYGCTTLRITEFPIAHLK